MERAEPGELATGAMQGHVSADDLDQVKPRLDLSDSVPSHGPPASTALAAEEPALAPAGHVLRIAGTGLEVADPAVALGKTAILLGLRRRVLGSSGLQLQLELLHQVLAGVQLGFEALALLRVDPLLERPLPAIKEAGDELAWVERRHRRHV